MALSLGACSNEDLDPKSVFDDSVSMPENDFDRWLKTNYCLLYTSPSPRD